MEKIFKTTVFLGLVMPKYSQKPDFLCLKNIILLTVISSVWCVCVKRKKNRCMLAYSPLLGSHI